MSENLYVIPNAYLIPVPAETCTRSVRLEPGDITIGRSPSNTIYLAQGAVSRNHAKITLVNGQYTLADLKSRNGTFVNKKRIEHISLKHGDNISFGDRSFIFSIKEIDFNDTTALYVSNKDSVSFEDDDIEMSDMVAQTAMSATRTFLSPQIDDEDISIEGAVEAHTRLSHLYQLSEKLRFANNADEILNMGIDLIFDALPSAERCVAMLRSNPNDPLEARIVKYRHKRPEGDVIPVSQTVISRVINEKLALVSKDALDDSRFEMADSIRVHSLKSIICVPLISSEDVIGVLHLDTSQILESFRQNDLEFTAAVANEMSITIDNSRLQHEAVQNERMAAIGLTISNIAHNIKNLLTMNKGAEDLMNMRMRGITDEKIQRSWQLVRECLGQINNLSANMLNFTRVHPVKLEPIDVNTTLLSYNNLFKENFTGKDSELVMDLDPNLSQWVMDEAGLRRALLNLVVNANDAIQEREKGLIRISTYKDNQNCLNISVSDNGCGIEKEQLINVFQLFFTTKGTKGSGLGLPMVQRFAERLGGTLSVDSQLDKGSTFVLSIPWIEEN